MQMDGEPQSADQWLVDWTESRVALYDPLKKRQYARRRRRRNDAVTQQSIRLLATECVKLRIPTIRFDQCLSVAASKFSEFDRVLSENHNARVSQREDLAVRSERCECRDRDAGEVIDRTLSSRFFGVSFGDRVESSVHMENC